MAKTLAQELDELTTEVAEALFNDYKELLAFIGPQPFGTERLTPEQRLRKLAVLDDLVGKLRIYQGYGIEALSEMMEEKAKLEERLGGETT